MPKRPSTAKARKARARLRFSYGIKRSKTCQIFQSKYNIASKYQVHKHKHLN